MFCPGGIFTNNRLRILTGADPQPVSFNGGFGFDADGRLCVSTGSPTGSINHNGFRFTAKGAIYGVNSASAPARYNEGLGFDADGALIFGNAAPNSYQNGVGMVSTGRVATINA